VSYSVDVNILLYASDEASPFHAKAKSFLEGCSSRADLFCIPWVVVISYVRISTHAAIFSSPLTPEDACSNVDRLLSIPRARMLVEEDGFWEVYKEVTRTFPARGSHVSDVHLASLLKQHGVRMLYTHDSDFRRFRFLDVHSPFEEE